MNAMTAAEYRANAARTRKDGPTETVTLGSGSIFELRRPDIQGMVLTGRLPQTLLTEAMAAWKQSGVASPDKIAEQLGDKEIVDSLIFMREIVHDACVNPKFVEFATAEDELGASDMLPADFLEIFNWAMGRSGAAGLEALKGFREGRERGTAGNGTDRKKRGAKAKRLTPA